jgi:hypothetical protein
MSKPFTVEHAFVLSLVLLLAGVALLIVGVLDLIGNSFGEIGAWGYWLAGIGVVLVLVGAIWLATYRINVRKFNALMEEKSKAAFVKKLDDVEYLAWRLPTSFEERLGSKKKDFGVK